eukprot:m.124510 g.124510  ORF g.124510 m.124510 type:complete len:308 (+) comp14474_c0_seq1:236-1159(+)
MAYNEGIPGDEHYLALSFLVTCLIQLSCFFVAATCKFDLITDFAGSTNFVVLGILSLILADSYTTRQVVLTVLLTISRMELALFLLYRVCSRKKDARFDEIRDDCCKFFGFWVFQIIWVYVVSFPVFWANSIVTVNPDIQALDIIGWVVWLIGFASQFSSDLQKLWFRKNPANKNHVCKKGLWAYSRHPNYFGEMLMWLGLFISTIPLWLEDGEGAGWATFVSPLLTFIILMFLSGMPTAEGASLKRFYSNGDKLKEEYIEYRERTPPIVFCCPPLYKAMPMILKRMFCCEWSIYEYRDEGNPLMKV